MLLCLLPGCSSIVRWAENEVPQLQKVDIDTNALKPYLKSVHIYDLLSYELVCDVLRVNRFVYALYMQLYKSRAKPPKNEIDQLLAMQEALEKKHITFIILVSYQLLLERKNEWKIMIEVGTDHFYPRSIEVIELAPEYRVLFGELYSPLKRAYKIVFDRPITNKDNMPVVLRFSNARGDFRVVFPEDEG